MPAPEPKPARTTSRRSSNLRPTPIDPPPPPPQQFLDDELLSLSNQAVCTFDDDLNCTYMSSNWKQITGLSVKECLNEGLWERMHTDFPAKLKDKLIPLLKAGKKDVKATPVNTRFQIKNKEGKWQWLAITVNTLPAAKQSDEKKLVGFVQDISAEIAAQKQLQKARHEAELALKGRSEFLANMSHELRTPLNAVIGFAQIMQNQLFGQIGNPKYHEYLVNIQDSAFALLSKINDLLEISNLEAGKTTLSEEFIDIVEVVRHAIEIQSHNAFSAQVTLRENLFRSSVLLRSDRVKLKQVISNILANAIKYNNPGGSVAIDTGFSPEGNLVLVVADTGTGISEKHLKNIHAAFSQEDSLFVRNVTNDIGLGLSIAKEFLSLHGGNLEISSEVKKGTTVTITLPKNRLVVTPPVSDETNQFEYKNTAIN